MLRVYLKRFLRRRMAVVGLALTVVIMVLALGAPLIARYPPHEQLAGFELNPPSGQFYVGTDELGRDLFSRILHGTRISLQVAVIAVGIASAIGTLLGLLAGYLEGWVDTLVMRVCDTLLAFPPMLAGIGIAAVLGPGAINVAVAAGIVTVPAFARQVRASVLSERSREYIEAASAMGATDGRIMARHLLPNILTPILVQVAVGMAYAVNMEAGLSFLGLGSQPPEASLGSTLNFARNYMRQAPWYSLFPGIMLALLLVALNFVAFAVRDVLDPRQKDLK